MVRKIAIKLTGLFLVAVLYMTAGENDARALNDVCNSGWVAGGWRAQYTIVDTEEEQAIRIYYTNTPTGIQFRVTKVFKDEYGRERGGASAHHFDKFFAREDLYEILEKHQPYKRTAAGGNLTNTYDYEYHSSAQLQVIFSTPEKDWQSSLNGAIRMSYSERVRERKLLDHTLRPGKSKVKGGWAFRPNSQAVSRTLRGLATASAETVEVVSYLKPKDKKAVSLMKATVDITGLQKLVNDLPTHLQSFEGPDAETPCPVDERF